MIKNRTQGQGKELLGLPRQVLRLVVGVLTGHTQLNRHLCIMGVVTNPFCEQCDEAIGELYGGKISYTPLILKQYLLEG